MKYLLAVSVAFLLFSCSDVEPEINEPISDIPYLEIVSVSPMEVTEYQDSIVFILFYQDGDGDLGYNEPDSLSLFVTDTRILITEAFHVPLLAPENTSVSIQGELQFILDRTILTGTGTENETVTFQLYLKDRAGNQSNTVISPAITVKPM